MEKGRLFLIPVPLTQDAYLSSLPAYNLRIISELRFFIAEELRSARRFLKRCNPDVKIDEITISIFNEHSSGLDLRGLLDPAVQGYDIGLMSEAGIPCIADPGGSIVRLAHEKQIRVVPLTGPSSLFLALAASGFNGQNFIFHGYLPVKPAQRAEKIKSIEKDAMSTGKTHLFIETPYRNLALFDSLTRICKSETMLCIACNLTADDEWIETRPVKECKQKRPDIHKRPAVFLIGR